MSARDGDATAGPLTDGGAPASGVDAGPDGGVELPDTGIDVEAHLHFGMTGSFPLRLGDLFFAGDGLYVVEYGYVTPFIGLTSRKHRREAAGMASLVEDHGIDAALLEGDRVVWHDYDDLDRVVVHHGGRVGRPKVAVYPETGPSHAFRFHDRVALEDGLADLVAAADRHGLAVEEHRGLGFTPRESLRRFFGPP